MVVGIRQRRRKNVHFYHKRWPLCRKIYTRTGRFSYFLYGGPFCPRATTDSRFLRKPSNWRWTMDRRLPLTRRGHSCGKFTTFDDNNARLRGAVRIFPLRRRGFVCVPLVGAEWKFRGLIADLDIGKWVCVFALGSLNVCKHLSLLKSCAFLNVNLNVCVEIGLCFRVHKLWKLSLGFETIIWILAIFV